MEASGVFHAVCAPPDSVRNTKIPAPSGSRTLFSLVLVVDVAAQDKKKIHKTDGLPHPATESRSTKIRVRNENNLITDVILTKRD
jgi:hypothetical protein